MELTDEKKKSIDNLSYQELLRKWRFAPVGDSNFQGDVGKYWAERMAYMRSQPGGQEVHVTASKALGWEG